MDFLIIIRFKEYEWFSIKKRRSQKKITLSTKLKQNISIYKYYNNYNQLLKLCKKFQHKNYKFIINFYVVTNENFSSIIWILKIIINNNFSNKLIKEMKIEKIKISDF